MNELDFAISGQFETRGGTGPGSLPFAPRFFHSRGTLAGQHCLQIFVLESRCHATAETAMRICACFWRPDRRSVARVQRPQFGTVTVISRSRPSRSLRMRAHQARTPQIDVDLNCPIHQAPAF